MKVKKYEYVWDKYSLNNWIQVTLLQIFDAKKMKVSIDARPTASNRWGRKQIIDLLYIGLRIVSFTGHKISPRLANGARLTLIQSHIIRSNIIECHCGSVDSHCLIERRGVNDILCFICGYIIFDSQCFGIFVTNMNDFPAWSQSYCSTGTYCSRMVTTSCGCTSYITSSFSIGI